MGTTVSPGPVVTDAADLSTPSRRWAFAGVGAAVAAIAGGVCAGMVDAVYDPDLVGDPDGIVERLGDRVGQMVGFHVLSTISALLMVVFALGLFRRLRAELGASSLVPGVAAFGVLATSVIVVVGGALNTEFVFGFMDTDLVNPANAAMYNHWIGTVPGCWVFVGLSALAMHGAARRGAVSRWIGVVGLLLGGLTLLVAIAPMQYMAGMTGGLWLLVTSLGLAFGRRR